MKSLCIGGLGRIDFEKRLREQKEKEEREEQEMFEEMQKKKVAKRAGLKPLGPVPCPRNSLSLIPEVMAREEAIDPLQKVAIAATKLKEYEDVVCALIRIVMNLITIL